MLSKSAGIGLSIIAVFKSVWEKKLGQDDFFVVLVTKYILYIIVQSHYCEVGLGLLFISLNHYFHFLLNIKEYDVNFFHVLRGSATSTYNIKVPHVQLILVIC